MLYVVVSTRTRYGFAFFSSSLSLSINIQCIKFTPVSNAMIHIEHYNSRNTNLHCGALSVLDRFATVRHAAVGDGSGAVDVVVGGARVMVMVVVVVVMMVAIIVATVAAAADVVAAGIEFMLLSGWVLCHVHYV